MLQVEDKACIWERTEDAPERGRGRCWESKKMLQEEARQC
jgi:hypothetical protein